MEHFFSEQDNYFNYLPDDIISQILLYLDFKDNIEELTKLDGIINLNNIISNKIFWKNKLEYDGLKEYIQFLNFSDNNDYISDYSKFIIMDKTNNDTINTLKVYRESKYFRMNLDINIEDIHKLIYEYSLDRIKKAKNHNYLFISYDDNEKYIIKDYVEQVHITKSEIKILLIKLELIGYKVFDMIFDNYDW